MVEDTTGGIGSCGIRPGKIGLMGSVGWWVLVIVAGLIAAGLLVAVWRLVAGPRRDSRGL
jgi:hypothetical protein